MIAAIKHQMKSLKLAFTAILFSMSILPSASATDISNWLKNLSAAADPSGIYIHESPKISVSGSYVHVAWLASKKDFSGKMFFYRRSIDGGKTWDTPKQLVKDNPTDLNSGELHAEYHNLVADGPYVHIMVTNGWPRRLIYLRSADYGASFENPSVWVSAYASYYGIHITAENGKVAVGWTFNSGDSPRPHGLYCQYSSDGGATFKNTVIASSNDSTPIKIDGMGVKEFTVVDAARSGDNVYLLVAVSVDDGTYSPPSYLYLHASNDGGKTFKSAQRVSVKSSNGKYYTTKAQDADYSPNLAVWGNNVHVVWVNIDNPGSFDGWLSLTLRVRKSSDGGATLSDPITLYKYQDGYQTGAQAGLETIWCNGDKVYVATCGRDGFAGTYLWRSTDAGTTWGKMQTLSTGGWWPQVQADPSNPARVHVVNSWYYLSTDSGATFNGGANPHYNYGNWDYPQFAVGPDGAAHYVGVSGGAYSNELFYRRLVPEPAQGATNKAVSLVKAAVSSSQRNDNIQIPASPDINFSSAMTVEAWVKRTGADDTGAFQPFLIKKRQSGWESYSIGTWNDFQIYCRITTDKQTGSVWLGSSNALYKEVWTHVALTYDANAGADNMRLYVNGLLVGKATVTGTILTDLAGAPLVIGREQPMNSATEFSVDELRLWNKARTQAEIVADLTKQLVGTESGLAAYYSFNDTFKDITGHGNNGIPMYGESFVTVSSRPPFVTTLFPARDAAKVSPATNPVMTFNEAVAKGSGTITITMPKGWAPEPVFETIDVSSNKVTVSGSTVTIKTTKTFNSGTKFYITMPATCFKNSNGINFQGITSPVSWAFTTSTLNKKDLIGTWAGQGIYYLNSDTNAWIKVSSAAWQIAAGDLDGDGKDDLVGLWSDGVWVKNSASGSWSQLSSPASWIAVADMNGDGKDDLLGVWGSTVYVRDSSTGTWTGLTTGATKVAGGDVDGDGKADLVGQWSDGIWVLLSSTGQWQFLSSPPDSFAVGDINGDGRADLVGVWGSGVWVLNTATGAWSNPTSGATKIAVGDLDGDGKVDLLGQWSDGIWVYYSSTGKWAWLSSPADAFIVGRLR